MIVELNPLKWFGSTTVTAAVVSAPPAVVSEVRNAAVAVESIMSTAAVTPAVPASKPNGFVRFIDVIGSFFVKTAPVLEKAAVAAEPFLALTPYGPEYDLVVNAVVGVQQTATASLAAGSTLSGVQKMALVVESVTPGVTAILASKGITEPAAVQQAVAEFAQNVYNLQAGPTTTVAPTLPVAAKPA